MKSEKSRNNQVWIVMVILSLLFLAWTIPLLLLSGGSDILEQLLVLAGSPMTIDDFDVTTLGSLNMAMLKPLWEELWIGILGIYCALGLRQGKRHAWTLGLFWGIMLIVNAAIQGGYEMIVLGWSHVCLPTYLFLGLGTVAVVGLMFARKGFFLEGPRSAT